MVLPDELSVIGLTISLLLLGVQETDLLPLALGQLLLAEKSAFLESLLERSNALEAAVGVRFRLCPDI